MIEDMEERADAAWGWPHDDRAGTPEPDCSDARFDLSPQVIRAESAIADILEWKLGPADRPCPGEQPPLCGQPSQAAAVPEVAGKKKSIKAGTRSGRPSLNITRPIYAGDVAQMAGCTPKHIYDLCSQPGAVPHSRRGRRITFDRAEIEAWLAGLKVA